MAQKSALKLDTFYTLPNYPWGIIVPDSIRASMASHNTVYRLVLLLFSLWGKQSISVQFNAEVTVSTLCYATCCLPKATCNYVILPRNTSRTFHLTVRCNELCSATMTTKWLTSGFWGTHLLALTGAMHDTKGVQSILYTSLRLHSSIAISFAISCGTGSV